MRQTTVALPVQPGPVEGENGLLVDLTDADADDLNSGHSITTLTPSGEEVAVFPSE